MNQIPPVTKNLLFLNVIFFLAAMVTPRIGIDLQSIMALHYFEAENFAFYQFITYMFMHGGFAHLFFNMFALWMFGCTLEMVLGAKKFLIYYMVCGLGAGLIQEVVQFVELSPIIAHYNQVNMGGILLPMADYLNLMNTVGASGAVFGILLAFGMLFPNQQMFVFPLPFPIKAKFFVIGYAAIELLFGFQGNDNVAHFAHLGGMLFGFLLITYWRKKYRNNGQYTY